MRLWITISRYEVGDIKQPHRHRKGQQPKPHRDLSMEGTRIRLMLSAQIIIRKLHAKIQYAGISMQVHEGCGAVGWVARYRDHLAVGTDKPSQIYIKLGKELDDLTMGYTVDNHPSFT